MTAILHRAALAAAAATALALPATGALAQSAEQYNRAAQAIQICSSGMGAMVPECAKLRGGLGMSVVSPQEAASAMGQLGVRNGGVPGIGGLGGFGGGGKAAGIVGLLGVAMTAARSQQAAAPPPVANPGAVQQAISTCVQNAGGNNAAIQACLQIASAATTPPPAYGAQQMLPSDRRGQDGAMATYAAGQSYQACVTANPGNWQACLQTMSGGAPAPTVNPFGGLLPRR